MWAAYLSSLAAQVWPAQPTTASSLSSSSPARRTGARGRPAPATSSLPACLAASSSPCTPSAMPRDPPDALSLSGSLSPSLLCFLSPWPSMPTATDAVRRGQSHCPASPSCLEEPPRRPTPPRRAARVGKPCFFLNAAVFFRGIRRSPSSLRRLQAFPEPDEYFNRRVVRLRSLPP